MMSYRGDFGWADWMLTTQAGARAVDSYRLVHLEIARRFERTLKTVDFLWCMNLYSCLSDRQAQALTADVFVLIAGQESEFGRYMGRALMSAIGHPSSAHLGALIHTDGRVRETGMKVEYLIGSDMIDRVAKGPLTGHSRLALLDRRRDDVERLRHLDMDNVLG